jgi:hypothetical protein
LGLGYTSFLSAAIIRSGGCTHAYLKQKLILHTITVSWDKIPKYRIIPMVPGLKPGTIVGEHGRLRRKLEKVCIFQILTVPTEAAINIKCRKGRSIVN